MAQALPLFGVVAHPEDSRVIPVTVVGDHFCPFGFSVFSLEPQDSITIEFFTKRLTNLVDQAQLVDVDWNFGVIDLLQRSDHAPVELLCFWVDDVGGSWLGTAHGSSIQSPRVGVS